MGSGPFRLETIEEAAKSTGLSETRILELCKDGYCPHHTVDGCGPYFHAKRLKDWAKDNLLKENPGRQLQISMNVFNIIEAQYEQPPKSISDVKGLELLPIGGISSGVYFLCRSAEVVYVGQGISVLTRLGQHIAEGFKKFDRAYWVRCDRASLTDMEKKFIIALRPEYNGGKNGLGRAFDPPNGGSVDG